MITNVTTISNILSIILNHDHGDLNVLKHEDDANNMGSDQDELNGHPVQGLPFDLGGWWMLLGDDEGDVANVNEGDFDYDDHDKDVDDDDGDDLLCHSVSPSVRADCPLRWLCTEPEHRLL